MEEMRKYLPEAIKKIMEQEWKTPN
jgi:hypothetical protein